MTKPKLMITGASGLLGHPLCRQAVQKWEVHALFQHRAPRVEAVTARPIDLCDHKAAAGLIRAIRPHALIHAAAVARPDLCQADPEGTARLNVQVPARLAALCAELDIGLVFVSTDLVFDGRQPPYSESSPVNPLNAYAEQKVRAETAVLQNHPQALVCRLPLMFGVAPYSGDHFSVQMLNAIRRGKPLHLFTDEYRTPVDTTSAAAGILTVLERARGILHLGGLQRIARYELGLMMAAAMQIRPTMIQPVTIAQLPGADLRAPDCSMDSRRAYALGYAPASLGNAVGSVVAGYIRTP